MASATYSVGTTGFRPRNPFGVKITLPDAEIGGNNSIANTNFLGAMSRGDVFLTRGADGMMRAHRIDAERSTPGYIVVIPV